MIIFDASIFIHANYHIILKFAKEVDSYKLGQKVCQQISNVAFTEFPGKPIYIALDPVNRFRNKIYPAYKAHRKPKNFDKAIVHEVLKSQFNCLEYDGLEADDVCYLFSVKYPQAIMISEDDDFRLMLKEDRMLWKYKQKNLVSATPRVLLYHQLEKICNGCKGDNVPSIKLHSFGPKRLNDFIDSFWDEFGDNLNSYLDTLIDIDWISDYQQNYELVMYDIQTYGKYFDHTDLDNFYQTL